MKRLKGNGGVTENFGDMQRILAVNMHIELNCLTVNFNKNRETVDNFV